uniref:Uncharacterized protein n=1 Tax=Rhizophora mucronata TaxID=61149 RepID=A0A2P2N3L1_RHIMU
MPIIEFGLLYCFCFFSRPQWIFTKDKKIAPAAALITISITLGVQLQPWSIQSPESGCLTIADGPLHFPT